MTEDKRTITMTLTNFPFTVNMKAPIPHVDYSNWFVGFTGVTLAVDQEVTVEVEATGSDLVDIGEAIKTVVGHFFELNKELAREAWISSKEVAEIYEQEVL